MDEERFDDVVRNAQASLMGSVNPDAPPLARLIQRRRRRRTATGTAAAIMVSLGAFAVAQSRGETVVDSGPDMEIITGDNPPGSQAELCPGSVLRTVDGGDPAADAIPPLESAIVDRAVAEQVLRDHRVELGTELPSGTFEIGPGFGRAWTGGNGGNFSTVDVHDFAIIVNLDEPSDCPTAPDLYRSVDGVSLFFRLVPSDRRCASDVEQQVAVPAVVGWHLNEAISLIEELGFSVVGNGVPDDDPTGADALVSSQELLPGSPEGTGTCIGLRTTTITRSADCSQTAQDIVALSIALQPTQIDCDEHWAWVYIQEGELPHDLTVNLDEMTIDGDGCPTDSGMPLVVAANLNPQRLELVC